MAGNEGSMASEEQPPEARDAEEAPTEDGGDSGEAPPKAHHAEEAPTEDDADSVEPPPEALDAEEARPEDDADSEEPPPEALDAEEARPEDDADSEEPPPEARGPKKPLRKDVETHRAILMEEVAAKAVLRHPELMGLSLFFILGGALAMVGLLDVAILWIPPDLGSAAWTFGTVGQTLDAVPIGGSGAALLTFALVRHPDAPARAVRGVSLTFAGFALIFVLAGLLYATAASSVMAEAPPQALGALRHSMIQSGLELVVYVLASGLVAIRLWRGVENG